MTEADMQHFALRIVQLSIAGGFIGAGLWAFYMWSVGIVISRASEWASRIVRIARARQRAALSHG